jgi:hypothetical protein
LSTFTAAYNPASFATIETALEATNIYTIQATLTTADSPTLTTAI